MAGADEDPSTKARAGTETATARAGTALATELAEPEGGAISPPVLSFAVVVLALHLTAGLGAIVILPRGFALRDLHFWANTVIPVACALAVIVALVGALMRRPMALRIVTSTAAGGWLSATISAAVLFPISMPLARCAVPWLGTFVMLGLAWKLRAWWSLLAAPIGALLGMVVMFAQRAPLPSTHPRGGELAQVVGLVGEARAQTWLPIACGGHQINVNALLTFESRSRDRTWTILASDGLGPSRTRTHNETTPDGFRATYRDDGVSSLVMSTTDVVAIEAVSRLDAPVYAHLDTFTAIVVPFDATIAFRPTGPTTFPIEPADYPTGRPSKLAYLDAGGGFHVVRASDAEKGPFTELARGALDRAAPIALELRASDGTGCRLTFDDWAPQVSTAPSPTAGWGVPQNSIQFFSRGGQGLVVLALAETGPGRGFDSVGHAAGTYRNRVRIEPLPWRN